MNWLSIILWLVKTLGPSLLAWIFEFWKRTRALAPIVSEGLRVELSTVIQSKRPRAEKRKLAENIVYREMAAEADFRANEAAQAVREIA